MGVYIKGMRMPKGCYDPTVAPSYCFLLVSGICKICHKYADEYGALPTERPEGCSLVEVAKPPIEDEPQEYPCEFCRNSGSQKCEDCKDFGSNYEPKDEPQTEEDADCRGTRMKMFGEMDDATFKAHCMNCQRDPADIKCLDCDGNKYFLSYKPQTDCPWK